MHNNGDAERLDSAGVLTSGFEEYLGMLSDQEVAAIRARFPIFRRAVYLNSCSQGALSDTVEESMLQYLRMWHNHGSPWDAWVEQYEVARQEFASLIGAEAAEIAVLPSVSAGVSSLATSFDFTRRKTVLMGELEFPTMGHIWMAQQRRGAKIKFLKAIDECVPAEHYAAALDRDTLMVPVTGVSFVNGSRSDIEAIVSAAHQSGAYVLLDDYQDCGTRPRNVRDLDVDFYAAGNLKYLLGAAGLAFLYVKRSLIASLSPCVSGWFAQQNPFAFATQRFEPSDSARRFESGTPSVPSVYLGLAGIRLLQEIGLENVSQHVERLTAALREGAKGLGIAIKTPDGSVGPLTVLKAKDAAKLVELLAKDDIICSSRHDGLRISFHVYNTLEDVKMILNALDKHIDLLEEQLQPAGAEAQA
jgi:selenocysteine lyase/cysteine desulfurase